MDMVVHPWMHTRCSGTGPPLSPLRMQSQQIRKESPELRGITYLAPQAEWFPIVVSVCQFQIIEDDKVVVKTADSMQ